MKHSLFLIKRQHKKVKDRTAKLVAQQKATRTVPIPAINQAIIDVDNACELYKKRTATFGGWLKSFFLPSTEAYKYRVISAQRLAELNRLLDKMQAQIVAAKKASAKTPRYISPSNAIKKSYSDSEVIIQNKLHKSPISQPPSQTEDDLRVRFRKPSTGYDYAKPTKKLL